MPTVDSGGKGKRLYNKYRKPKNNTDFEAYKNALNKVTFENPEV